MMRIPTDKWKDEPLTKEMIEELHKKLKKQREEEDKTKIKAIFDIILKSK